MSPLVLVRRLLLVVPTLFGVALVVFVLMRVVPGDPVSMMIGPGATAQDIAALRALYGLDHGIPTQFAYYLGDLARGEFGISISRKQPVTELIAARLPLTL
jgi:peptide/nickel transport system permease protein